MKNIKDLRDSLLDSFEDLKSGKLRTKDAKEITNMSGKIILSAKVELDYNKFMKLDRKIDFLDVSDETSGEEVSE
jgi:hypothetical protein